MKRRLETGILAPLRTGKYATPTFASPSLLVHGYMARRFINRYLPNAQTMREHPSLRPLGRWLQNPEIWHLHRRSVSGACFIGLFCAFLPLPMHMLIAGAMAIATRCNLPLSLALVWVANPLTIPPMFFFAYKVGAWMLDSQMTVTSVRLDFDWLAEQFDQIWRPLVLGSLVCGWVSGIAAFAIARVAWRIDVARRWRARQRARQPKQSD
jgi:uncharacterized protein